MLQSLAVAFIAAWIGLIGGRLVHGGPHNWRVLREAGFSFFVTLHVTLYCAVLNLHAKGK